MSADFAPYVFDVAEQIGIDPYMLWSMMQQESQGKNTAKSKKGAMGLMQLMPRTYNSVALGSEGQLQPYSDRTDPYNSLLAGGLYYKQMLKQKGTPKKALIAYNAGPNTKKPNNKETNEYIKNVMNTYRMGKAYERLLQGEQQGQQYMDTAVRGNPNPLASILGAQ